MRGAQGRLVQAKQASHRCKIRVKEGGKGEEEVPKLYPHEWRLVCKRVETVQGSRGQPPAGIKDCAASSCGWGHWAPRGARQDERARKATKGPPVLLDRSTMSEKAARNYH